MSDPVAELIAERWQLAECPGILLNCPPAWRPDDPAAPVLPQLRAAAGVAADVPLVLYQGGFSVDRGVEELAAAIDAPELRALGAVAVFMGYGRLEAWLRAAARERPDRIRVLPAVPPDVLLGWTAGADVSFVGQPPRTLNQRMNLPNKLFESMMAGVPVVVARGNEQCRLVTAEAIGRCATVDDPAEVAAAIAGLLRMPPDAMAALRLRCRTIALDRYTWDGTAGARVDLYRRLAAA
ncbi:MAG: glycosyltransferase [Chloroflexota bacterium]